MQRSIPRLILETTAIAATVVLLLYVLFGPPTQVAAEGDNANPNYEDK